MSKPKVILKNAIMVVSEGKIRFHGQAYGHPKGADGEYVTTTSGKMIEPNIFESKNTIYKIESLIQVVKYE